MKLAYMNFQTDMSFSEVVNETPFFNSVAELCWPVKTLCGLEHTFDPSFPLKMGTQIEILSEITFSLLRLSNAQAIKYISHS